MTKNKTIIKAEPGVQELFIIREFDAPHELVYKAHTDPDLFARWIGPRGLFHRVERCSNWAAMALKQLNLVIRGRVQGVYFRASAQREAKRLGLTGWVKNRSDGSVEILAEGEETSIRELYGWAQKGPSAARVDRVDTRWRSFSGDFPDFRIVD